MQILCIYQVWLCEMALFFSTHKTAIQAVLGKACKLLGMKMSQLCKVCFHDLQE